MKTVAVRYKVKSGKEHENVQFVRAVFAELKQRSPDGVKYSAYVADDGLSFMHVATFSDGVENPMPQLESFKAFQNGLKDRCDEPPSPTHMSELASYLG